MSLTFSGQVVGTKLLKGKRRGAVSEKSTRSDVDYPAKSQNSTAVPRFAFADVNLACKVTPKQYNFSHAELKRGDS